MPEGKVASSTLLRATPLLALALRAAADGTTARVTVDTAVAYNSSDWSSSWVELESVRNILGTMNGPREVYAFDDEHGAYDTAQYAASFDELAPYAVRFNDMNYLNGGYNSTSITQIFRAWPLTDAALSELTASEIAALASDDGNYVWEGVDYNVGGACAAGSVELMDFRVGDTYQVTNALNKGEAVPMGGGNATTFPASWMFPTDVLTENGIALWAAHAPLVLSCVLGTGMSWFGLQARLLLSPTTYSVVGVLCKVFTIVINLLVWDRASKSSHALLCVALVLGGGAVGEHKQGWGWMDGAHAVGGHK